KQKTAYEIMPSLVGSEMCIRDSFKTAKMRGHLRSGPTGQYLDGFAAALERQCYSPATAVRYLRAAAHVGHVLAEQRAGLGDIDLAAFEEHLRSCRCPRARGGRR
ncbi:MAG TPA: hypothetical protein DDW26_05025, partial [Rhizobiales bacterium]|nr:hypothetical protein [Hyphomicrobiales bacterium]